MTTLLATSIALLLASIAHGFQPPAAIGHRQHRITHHVPLHSSTEERTTEVVTSPITGSETNIKYPTARGSAVDSRLFIDYKTSTSSDGSPLLALRLSHILFASKEMASQTLDKLTKAEWNFEEMAEKVSNCGETREEGGSVGWVNLSEDFSTEVTTTTSSEDEKNPNEHLDLILPAEAREQILSTPTKPGDILMVESFRGVHLVQIVDVMVDVRQLSYVKARKTKKKKKEAMIIQNDMELGNNANVERKDAHGQGTKLAGVLGGALLEEDVAQELDLTYKIETMGCQMNSADSERIEGQLMSLGIRPLLENEMKEVTVETDNDGLMKETKKIKQEKKKPDVIVLNTCSIRDRAEQKVYSYLGPHAKRKRDGEDITIIVAGCVAQQEGQSLLRRIPEIDLVMGPQYANRISDLLEDVANGNQVVATEASHIMEDSTKPRRQSAVCGWVNVIYGCNERCTYCIVPTTRGVEQSRPVESIVDEVKELVSQGFKEVTLLGQNIDAYGR